MPKITLDPENKSENPSDFPKLMLDKGERARVLLIEREPEFGYTHTLKAPLLDHNDKPTMISVVARDGSSREEMDMEFLGRHLCLGDLDVIAQKGMHPEKCPECKAAMEGNGEVPVPERRFAMNIVRYACKPGGFEPQDTLNVSILAWTFNDRRFGKLVDKKQEWGDLMKHDLLIGPCTSKQYQNYDIEVGQFAHWLSDASVVETNGEKKFQLGPRGQMVQAAYSEQRSKDLLGIIGRTVTREQMEEDISVVLARWAKVRGTSAPAAAEVQAALDIGGLLGEGSVAVAATPAPATAPIEIPVEPGVPVDLAPPVAVSAAPAAAEVVTPPAPSPEPEVAGPLDLDSLLEGIK